MHKRKRGVICPGWAGPGKKSAFMADPGASADILLHLLEERRSSLFNRIAKITILSMKKVSNILSIKLAYKIF
jgi:hypothetical protein